MRGSLLAVLGFSLIDSLAIAAPHPQPSTQTAPSLERIVALKDGAIFRGEVLELVPGDYILLKLRRGQEKRFSWGQIESVTVPGRSAELPAAPDGAEESSKKAAPVLNPQTASYSRVPVLAPPTSNPARPDSRPSGYDGDEEIAHSPPRPAGQKGAASGLPKATSSVARDSDDDDWSSAHAKNKKQAAVPLSKTVDPPEPGAYAPKVPPRRRMLTLPAELAPYKDQFVRISLKSSDPDIRLEYKSASLEAPGGMGSFWPASLEAWSPACEYPCGEYVYRGSTYRVTGPDIMTSGNFTLPNRGTEMALRVKGGSVAARGFGIMFDILGGLTIVVGASVLLLYDMQFNTPGHGSLDGLGIGGLTTTLIGGGMLAGGIALTVAGSTSVKVERPIQRPEE